jgi:hypothetical protein
MKNIDSLNSLLDSKAAIFNLVQLTQSVLRRDFIIKIMSIKILFKS